MGKKVQLNLAKDCAEPISVNIGNMWLVNFAALMVSLHFMFSNMYNSKPLAIPFIMAFFLAFIVFQWSETLRMPHIGKWSLPKIISLPLSIVTILGTFGVVISRISNELQLIAMEAPKYQNKIIGEVDPLKAWAIDKYPDVTDMVAPYINDLIQAINFPFIVSALTNVLGDFAGKTSMVLFLFIFLLGSYSKFGKKIDMIDNEKTDFDIGFILTNIKDKVLKYLSVKTASSFLTALLSYAAFKIVGVDYAGLWAFIIFFLNFLPNVGSLLSAIPPVFMTIVIFGISKELVAVPISLLVINLAIGNILEPKVMGKMLNLDPTIIIIGLFVLATVWGILGAFFCIIILTIVHQTLAQIESTRWIAILMSSEGNIENRISAIANLVKSK